MKKVFLFLTASLFGVAAMAGNSWELDEESNEIEILWNEYGGGKTAENPDGSYQWQAGNADVLPDATGNTSWVPAFGEKFMVTLTATPNFSSDKVQMFIVDEREEVGYWAQLSAATAEMAVTQDEEFTLTRIFNLDNVTKVTGAGTIEHPQGSEVDGGLTLPGLIIAVEKPLPIWSETATRTNKSGSPCVFSNVKLEILYASAGSYENPFELTYGGPADKAEDGYQYQGESKSSITTAKVGQYVNVSFSGKAISNVKTIMYSLVDVSAAASYWTAVTEMTTFATDIEAGQNVNFTFSIPVTIATPAATPEFKDVFLAQDANQEMSKVFDNYSISSDVTATAKYSSSSLFIKNGIKYQVLNEKEVEVVKNYKEGENSYTGDIVIPQTVSVDKTFSVTSIGDYAFRRCSGLTSVTIGNSVTSIGEDAFYGCSNLKEVINLSSLEIKKGSSYNGYVAYYADYVCNGEKVVIGDFIFSKADKQLVWYTGSSANVVLPEYFEGGSYTIGSKVFANHTEIQSLTIPSSVTSIGENAFYGCSGLKEVINQSSMAIKKGSSNNGFVAFYADYVCNGEKVVIGDFIFSKADKQLVWYTGSSANVVLPENFEGDSYTIGSNAFAIHKEIQSLTIPSSVTSIGEGAFAGCSGLKNVVIGENVTTIGKKAFSDCSALSRVTCYAVNPPDADASSFSNYNGYLTIPCDNFEAYDIHPVWGNFKHIECISAESTELPKDEVVVEPEISEAVFSMPTNASANSYTLTIQNNGVTFCTLTFNNQGQLANIDFSNSQLKAAVEGYQFTVIGLSAATGYNYSFKALDKNKSVLKEYTGSFTTKNADGTGGSSTTAIDDVELANAISIINNQIFVNGEAPAFVITSLGQKIANQNLKAGIYFVQVGNEMQGVSIK